MSSTRRYGEPDWAQRPIEDPTARSSDFLRQVEHTNQSFEEWREKLWRESSATASPSSASHLPPSSFQTHSPQPRVPTTLTMSTSLMVVQDAVLIVEATENYHTNYLFWSAECADCTIKFNALEWPVHRSILSHGCKWFKQALSGHFQEAKTGILDMPEDDPHVVEGLLMYIYTLEYPEWHLTPQISDKTVTSTRHRFSGKIDVPAAQRETHLGLFKIADKICLGRLKSMAKKKLQSAMHKEWALGNFYRLLEQLWDMEQQGSTDLKNEALSVVSANAGDVIVKESFQKMLINGSRFAVDLVQRMTVQAAARSREEDSRIKLVAELMKDREALQRQQEQKHVIDLVKSTAFNSSIETKTRLSRIQQQLS